MLAAIALVVVNWQLLTVHEHDTMKINLQLDKAAEISIPPAPKKQPIPPEKMRHICLNA